MTCSLELTMLLASWEQTNFSTRPDRVPAQPMPAEISMWV